MVIKASIIDRTTDELRRKEHSFTIVRKFGAEFKLLPITVPYS